MTSEHKHSSDRSFITGLFAIACAVVAFDQLTKILILQNLELYESVRITSFLNFVSVFNRGAAFGFGSSSDIDTNTIFIFITIVALGVIFYLIRSSPSLRSQSVLAYVLVAGGAAGNLIDRIIHGHVVDFLDFHYAGWHFWTFNIADSAITVGAIFLIMEIAGIRILFRK